MEITVSVFWIVLLIVIVHTVLQHLINWGWRGCDDDNEEFGMIFATVLEFFALIVCLSLTLN